MFAKRRCHFTHIFELFARYIYAVIAITVSIAFSFAGNIASNKELVDDVKEASGIVMSADGLAVLAVIGVLLLSYVHFYYGLAEGAHGAEIYSTWLRIPGIPYTFN